MILALFFGLAITSFHAPALAAVSISHIQSSEATSLIKSDGSYWVWGSNQSVPVQIHELTEVEKSFNCQLVMKKDHTVWFFQWNPSSGGIETYQLPSLNGLIDVQSAWSNTLALDEAGSVYLLSTKGEPDPDQLNQILPLSGINNVMDISRQSIEMRWVFLKKDGTVWINKGDFPAEAFEPIQSLDHIIDIEKNIALKQDGSVWSWPDELRNESSVEPVTATPINQLTDIRTIKSYGESNVAIDQKSCLWFWGITVTGYSDGAIRHNQPIPVKLTSIKDVKEAFVVERSLIVLTQDGNVYMTSIERETMPENPVFDHLTSNVQQIKAGSRHIIMQKKDGSLWGWGVNKGGELGCGDFEFMHNVPQPVQKPVSIYLNDESISLNSGVIIRNGQAFIPLRSVFEKMGATLNWDAANKIVTINRTEPDKQPVTITINYTSGKVDLNHDPVMLSNAPFILVSTGYLPLRFISESLGAKVEWVQNEDKILISLP